MSRREDLSRLVALACEQYGRLDVLVNNAGVMPVSPLDELRVEEWEAMIDVNIKGVLEAPGHLAERVRQQRGRGVIGYRGSSGCHVLIVFHKPIMNAAAAPSTAR